MVINQEILSILTKKGEDILSRPVEFVNFSKNKDADILLNDLDHYPHAFVLACIMDRQIKAEKAWIIPYLFKKRAGSFEMDDLQALSLENVRQLMFNPKPLHRFSEIMTKNFYLGIQQIANQYSGKASNIWGGRPSSATIVRRFLEFKGAGPKIATMAANILIRRFKIPVKDKMAIDISPDIHIQRVFTRLHLISEGASNQEIIYKARELSPEYPGIFDFPTWEIGRNWCNPTNPNCHSCYLGKYCPSANYEKR